MMRRPQRASEQGVTLIEAMVAIAILSMVSLLIAGGFTHMSRNREKIDDHTQRSHAISMALRRIQRELSMAYVSAQVNPNDALTSVRTCFIGRDRSNGDRIDFTSFSHQRLIRDSHESDQNELSYFLARHPEDNSRRVLARREDNRVDDRPQEGGRVEILLEDVEDFQLEYLDPQTGLWQQTWDTTQAVGQANRLPSQVKIVLTVQHPRTGRNEVYATRAMVPIEFALNHAIYNP